MHAGHPKAVAPGCLVIITLMAVAQQHLQWLGLRTLHAASAGPSYKLDMHASNATFNV
jgi:hypothetical protein